MTPHEYLAEWFRVARDRRDDTDEVIDGLFGYLEACNLQIVEKGERCPHVNTTSVKRMLGRRVYVESYCFDCKERIRERVERT